MSNIELDMGGETVAAQKIVFVPFADDKNRDRMGPFADLTLTFLVSDKVPGDVITFSAATAGDTTVYSEEIAFQKLMGKE